MSTILEKQIQKIDHRYSPLWWQTLICLPDDPVKTLVGKEGQFFLDYGSGGPRNFQTRIQFDLAEGTEWVDQHLSDPSVPVVLTHKRGGAVTIEETSFLEPPRFNDPQPLAVRYDGFETLSGWADPTVPCDPAFRDAAVRYPSGSHEASLEIHLHVPAGAERAVVLGFCEGRQTEVGKRRLIALVEGAGSREIDPVRDFGANVPGVHSFQARDTDGDGRIIVSLKFHPDTRYEDGADRISDQRTIMLSAIWSFAGEAPAADEIISGAASEQAEAFAAGQDLQLPHRRNYLVASFWNPTGAPVTVHPILRIAGLQEARIEGRVVKVGPHNRITSSTGFGSVLEGEEDRIVELGEVVIGPGKHREVSIILDRFSRGDEPLAEEPSAALAGTRKWWTKHNPARDLIQVPDPSVQAMVESCIRNIFQARDIRNGLPSFHVGPTIYRGLFLADGAFMLELAAMLGKVEEARAGITYLRGFELAEGGFNVIDTYYKENGIAIFALVRHAQLTHDKEWLRENWGTITGCARRIQALRKQTPKGAPNEGLLPAGAFCDGGVFNNDRPFAEYSNPAWCLSGLKWAIEAAEWLGKSEDALAWQAEYDDFRGAFQRAAEKDLISDPHGNLYLPVVQGNGDNHAPPRGQWAFCHSVHPGAIWDPHDPIALGNLAMLRDAMVEGVVLDTGWMEGGLWSYFSSFYAHALLSLGHGEEVPQILYDLANHSSPTLVWREEQKPQGHGYQEVGDMPHNWASAEFVRMLIHMLEIDRGTELHLLEGFPPEWAAPGCVTRLHGIRTPFGPIDFEVDGLEAGLRVKLEFGEIDHLPSLIVVHRKSWGGSGTVEMLPEPKVALTVDRM
jgi:hypothetical protein